MHECSRENSFASAVAEINKCASWYVERVVPAIRVFVPLCLLNPFEDLVERFELYFAIGQVSWFYAPLLAFSSTFLFAQLTAEIQSYKPEDLVKSINLSVVFLR